MNKNELRVGNWVMHDNVPIKVESIGDLWININFSHSTYDNVFFTSLETVNPIPLTEGIFLKSGFIQKAGEYGCQHNDSIFWVIKYFNGWEICQEYTDSPFPEDEGKKYSIIFEIRSVHQLQNAFYPLLNKELEINL
jgi:hypothetical protein